MRVSVVIVVVASLCAAAAKPTTTTTRATTRPTTRRSSTDVNKAMRRAIAALTDEFLHQPALVRTTPNYFKDHPAKDLTTDAVLDALIGPVNAHPRVAAYVKWQLLSGLPDKLDDDDVNQLIQAYNNAPVPITRPGMTADDQAKLDQAVRGAMKADEPDLVAQMEQAVEANARSNAIILTYRDELYRRIPSSPQAFAAALDDLLERLNAGADGKELIRSLAADVKQWAATEPPPDVKTLQALGQAVRKLADTKSPQYYQSPYWPEHGTKLAFHKTRSGIDTGRNLKTLAQFLDEQSAASPVDLSIKDSPEKKQAKK